MSISTLVFCILVQCQQFSGEVFASPRLRHGNELEDGLFLVTGSDLLPGQTTFRYPELPDPSPPYLNEDGQVEIYGSARYFIRFNSWKEFSEGGPYVIVPIDMRYPNKASMDGNYAHAWDVRKYRIFGRDGSREEVLLGGTMSPPEGSSMPVWPDDNRSRRIFAFRKDANNSWIRDSLPLFGDVTTGWLEHSYGGNFFQPESPDPSVIDVAHHGKTFFFYERVSEVRDDGPYKTEIFAREVAEPGHPSSEPELDILRIERPPYPATRRSNGGYLIEGPRPIQIEVSGRKFFLIGFSSGDFCTDGYQMNYAWSHSLTGPYHQALDSSGSDLLDLGIVLKKRYGLSWLGRPVFYRSPDGEYEVLFHAVRKQILPDHDYTRWPTTTSKYQLWEFYRSIFKAKLAIGLNSDGSPRIALAIQE
ncbi:MAG: hypothetical protein A2428_07315 [Bdellovibrionales bacterium RIFOXYC1_FULL_54_43]|nr:MAG: hypothetical protein A2428_07315 [Bdellovibrionales bacterium RIFOXYC1_FULL_54_43]OFZ85843.1 MAG: hypothetical protein A2603_13685 [Bdellovibrionales bacterium RIFOXYD1_FULL_55_31]